MPVLVRLLLSEIAGRRGQSDEQLLADLIRQAAITELGREPNRPAQPPTEPAA